MRQHFLLIIVVSYFCTILVPGGAVAIQQDTDKDGLSDFQEIYKYFTNPNDPDSDNDGIPDGDWKERREYQYTIRTVVQVIRPVTPEYLNDDYQDARVLDETDWYVELEVIHYPFNQVADSITEDASWRENNSTNKELSRWLEPGPTSNHDDWLKNEIRSELRADGIDIEKLTDREVAQQVSKWLLERAEYHNGFSTFITAFDESGKPYIPNDLKDAPDRESPYSVEQQWDREILARQMFENKMHGSCSSCAIYFSGCLRACDLPTRTILCIPLVDANDDSEVKMLENIQNDAVRSRLKSSLGSLRGSWASHTFNEVYVGGRWHRLNYSNLGQNIYDTNLFGLATHVATFHDWADAEMYKTIGKRNKLNLKNVSGTANPYSTLTLRDEVGQHCKVKLPELNPQNARINTVHWTDSQKLDQDILENCQSRNRFGLIAEVEGLESMQDVREFLEYADLRVYLKPVDGILKNNQRIGISFDPGCFWLKQGILKIYMPFGPSDKANFRPGVDYIVAPRNQNDHFNWVSEEVKIKRE